KQNPEGLKCFVYFNLHRKVWSIKALEGPNKGRVIAHSSMVEMSDCSFKVSEAGRQRVLAEKRKNVHAGIVGIVRTIGENMDPLSRTAMRREANWVRHGGHPAYTPITYNPYKFSTFVRRSTETPVTSARWALLDADTRTVGAAVGAFQPDMFKSA
ncbi:MAG: hypothetical protein VX416_14705, partial [Pseudomonadota bacterium]|nr:hypothetical protein [Pseudomonadota bacterium]